MNSREIAVEFDSVSFAYGDLPVLEKVSFHIHRGEFTALVGPNGSGKTTLLKLILGLEDPAAGQIKLFGATRSANSVCRIGYVPQQPQTDRAFPITVRDVVRMGLLHPSRGYSKRGTTVDKAMEQADIADLAPRSWQALSGGQKRRVLVARALAGLPELLILDEPTANMDSESEIRLFETLEKLKSGDNDRARATILIVTHDMDFVSVLTDRVLCFGDSVTTGTEASREHHRGELVQHRMENFPPEAGRAECCARLRVLHGENIPCDNCCRH